MLILTCWRAVKARSFIALCLGALGALGGVLVLPGCIAGEIRDEVKLTNQRLDMVQESLKKLDATNLSLTTTNTSLEVVEGQLQTLKSVDTSLVRLDGHLASLRGTIGKLDGVIPFLDLGSGDVTPTEGTSPAVGTAPVADKPEIITSVPPAEGAAPGTQSQDARDAVASGAGVQGAATREPLLGTWLTEHPGRGGVLVLLPDGRYVFSIARENALGMIAASNAIERGTWKRIDRSTLEFNVITEGSADYFRLQIGTAAYYAWVQARNKAREESASPEQGQGERLDTMTPSPRTWKIGIILQSNRSVTTEIGENIFVWTRP